MGRSNCFMLNKPIARYTESGLFNEAIKYQFTLSFKQFKFSLSSFKISIGSFMEGSYIELERDYL